MNFHRWLIGAEVGLPWPLPEQLARSIAAWVYLIEAQSDVTSFLVGSW